MTTHSDDASTGMLFSNTLPQWRIAIHATVAVSRLRKNALSNSTCQQGLGGLDHRRSEFQPQNGPRREHDTHNQASQASQANHDVEANQSQAAPLDTKAFDKALEDQNPEVVILKEIRDELVKQLDAYGLVLVLLAGITFVAILQPPGSFENGKLQGSLLVSLFMLLSTLSFFIACTGLGAVMVGCAQLFRPFFHAKLAKYTDAVSKSKRLLLVENGLSDTTETPARRGWWFGKWLLGCCDSCENGPNYAPNENIQLVAALCVENVFRIRRIRFYLGVALVVCIAAYICGALAVMVTNDLQRYMLVGAMGVGGVILIVEICITLSVFMMHPGKSK